MKYRCTHCSNAFELNERDFQRCPSCFWTTSLVPFEQAAETSEPVKASQTFSPKPPKSNFVNAKLIIFLLTCAAIGTLIGIFVALKPSLPKFSLPVSIPKTTKPDSKGGSSKKSGASLISFLNAEEKARLAKLFQITIPRQLTEDEEEVLKKQVSVPKSVSDKPKISTWNKDDFEKMLEAEQKKRKVYLGWAYERAITKVFEKYYPSAAEAYEKGDSVLARELFIKSLTFPIYRNNVVRHRAVALVMLRPYINDVIGKIATINQYMTIQKSAATIDTIHQSYQELFSVLDLHEWEKASQMMADLKGRIDAFESQPAEGQVDYGAAFGLLDPEIRTAVQIETQPKPEAAANFKAMVVDLNLKEQIVRQNTADELLKVQKAYEEISRLIQEGDLEGARNGLREIQFPPELVEDARAKMALIDQAEALRKAKEEKKK